MRRFKLALCCIMSVLLLVTAFGCGEKPQEDGVPVSIVVIKGSGVDNKAVSMFTGSTLKLTALLSPSNATDKTVTWTSDNSSVASVDTEGLVTAKSAGSAKITATAGQKSDTVTVTVVAEVGIESMRFKQETYEISAQKSSSVSLGMAGELVFEPVDVTNKNVTWKLEPIGGADASHVTVSATGEVTVVKEKAVDGTEYTLTATSAKDTSKSARTMIRVKHTPAESVRVRYAHEPSPNAENTYTFPLSYSAFLGLNLVAEPTPSGAMDQFTFTSKNPGIVDVETDAKFTYGTFRVKAVGKAVIDVVSKQNAQVKTQITIHITATPVGEEFVILDENNPNFNLNLTTADITSIPTDTRTYWNFDPEGTKYAADRKKSFDAWHNTNEPGKANPPIEMMNSGNGQSIFDGGYAICFDSWDWPQDNEQTNLYVYNKVTVPENDVLKFRVRTQSEGGVTGKGKFRVRLVDLGTYESYFLQKDALTRVSSTFQKPDDRPETDAGTQNAEHWVTLDSVPDFTTGMDWFHFTVPAELKNKTMLLVFEVDDLHTSLELGTDGCDRIQFLCCYFADNTNPDPNDLRTEG